ncbi:thiamine phosphate synthase [Methanosalsum natronophilum]|uniref:Thiamine-phosphate synthase n=1 Tax=Methanosalsum natronophilum TaxID=768733 RepID=A0A424YLZ0_9EURY|nr:thiamine phosphate synthase [Methanosalsum natronophilum]MCS3924952.1 thiamine-phosphate pyrophosphorylase [Methanosalsum natronophilum]RQD79987.1 MAG: thiamine phosphate synthase [Methanosalsum natronophilum]
MTNKKTNLELLDFYFITDSRLSKKGIFVDVKEAIDAGCRIVQYREKNKCTKDMLQEAFRIKELCSNNSIFVINDRVDVALGVDADGVHLGQDDMDLAIARNLLGTDKIIGLTVHNAAQAREAELQGADYVGLSPIFNTSTKMDSGSGIGLERISGVKQEIKIPVVAIGGINVDNCESVIKAGADSIVSISAVLSSDDVKKEVKNMRNIIMAVKEERYNP